MKIQSIKIKDSKTILNSFEWSSDKPINIFIGENGSGKSTLLRHLVDVFKNAYEFYVEGNKNTTTPDFDFEIKYEIIIETQVEIIKSSAVLPAVLIISP
jgi:predicted ATPase